MSTLAPRRGALLLASAAAVALVYFAFQPTLSAGFQEHWDDNYNVTQNGHFRGLSPSYLAWMLTAFRLGHWQPLSWLSLALDHAVWGMDPFGYHLTNLALHAVGSVLFFFTCRAVLRAAGSPAAERVWPSLVGTLLFAVHPLRVESVAWVTERRDVLSTPFLLATLLFWLRWCEHGRRRDYLMALVLYAPSLMAKAWGITLPAVLLVLDVWPLRRLSRDRIGARILEKLPFLVLAALAAILAFVAQKDSGAMHYAEDFTLLQKAAQACYGLCFYVAKSLWPANPSPVYVLDTRLDPFEGPYLLGFAGVALGTAAVVALRRRWPGLAAACAVYAIVVAPVLGITQSGLQLVADRYAYLATMPFAMLGAALVARPRASGPRFVAAAGAAAIIALLCASTRHYARVWKDSRTLFEYTAERRPDEWFAWVQLATMHYFDGGTLAQAGRAAEAKEEYGRAMELYDRSIALGPFEHLPYESRGILRHRLGDVEGAIADWGRAIELNRHCPIPMVNRGTARFQAGDFAGARADYVAALDLKKEAGTYYMLGSTYAKLGRTAEARAALQRCLELASPKSPLERQAAQFLAELAP